MNLPPEVKEAIAKAKNAIRNNTLRDVFGNSKGRGHGDGPPLPDPAHGCKFVEWDVGKAGPEDRGARRLVFELHSSGRILETYYTDEHYAKFSFLRIV